MFLLPRVSLEALKRIPNQKWDPAKKLRFVGLLKNPSVIGGEMIPITVGLNLGTPGALHEKNHRQTVPTLSWWWFQFFYFHPKKLGK